MRAHDMLGVGEEWGVTVSESMEAGSPLAVSDASETIQTTTARRSDSWRRLRRKGLGAVDHSDTDEITQYHLYDDFALDMLYFNGINNQAVGEHRRRWDPRGDDAFAMFPAEDEPGSTSTIEYLVRPKEGASVECGPYEVTKFRDSGVAPNPETIHRGAVCARPYECTPPPDDPDACWGLAYTLEWCDEPPPPCEDEAGD